MHKGCVVALHIQTIHTGMMGHRPSQEIHGAHASKHLHTHRFAQQRSIMLVVLQPPCHKPFVARLPVGRPQVHRRKVDVRRGVVPQKVLPF